MKRFAALIAELESTSKTTRKVDAIVAYFSQAPPADAAWALSFLSGERLKRTIAPSKLTQFAIEESNVPEWLFFESHDAVGDLGETIALLLPSPQRVSDGERSLAEWVEEVLLPLQGQKEEVQREAVAAAWRALGARERLVVNKILTGSFRVGVAHGLVLRALAKWSGLPERTLASRLAGTWRPSAESWSRLLSTEDTARDVSAPYPFLLAHPVEDPDALGDAHRWASEWKWDGIRGQLIRREGQCFIWSRGEELVTERYPEVVQAARTLPDGTVMDGELLAWSGDSPLPFQSMQRRIGRRTLSPKLLADVPVAFLAFDLLEENGVDLRDVPWSERRERLERLLQARAQSAVHLSPVMNAASWEEVAEQREQARERGAEGLMLKRRDSPYAIGRPRGIWWKWKVVPFTVDAVLIYAQRGHGQRASLYTDYTFALWKEGELVPFAKAYSGLTDEEIRKVDSFVRRNTLEKFGPVRRVEPRLVFELAFEGIQASARHKSGVAVRFPRIHRWREDKTPEQADSLEAIVNRMKRTQPVDASIEA
jgi:DNA ligase-1